MLQAVKYKEFELEGTQKMFLFFVLDESESTNEILFYPEDGPWAPQEGETIYIFINPGVF